MPDNKKPEVFIDTNLWLYAFIESDDSTKTGIARTLIKDTNPVISTQVINEVCVNLIRKANFNEEQITQLIESFYQKYPVVELNKSILLDASRLRQRYSLSFWDSLVIASALYTNVSTLYSEDLQHGIVIEKGLRIINPFVR